MSKFNICSKVGRFFDTIEADVSAGAWSSLTFGYAVGLIAVTASVAIANKIND